MKQVLKDVQKLIEEREKLRNGKKYTQADRVRKQIEQMGYEVADTGGKPQILKIDAYTPPKKSFLAIFGSGEIAPSSVKTHSQILEAAGKDEPCVVILSTPAGFQPNVKVVAEEIAAFFEKHLQNFHPRVEIIYANTLSGANNPKLAKKLERADYIFAGPGSPTYALRNLKNSLLYDKIRERVHAGASVGLSSAAAIAFSKFCLPVYEIYKAGFNVYWEDGLNFYADIFKELTVIPHFNNTEGGKKNDTSHTWMGKKRFGAMRKLLPPKTPLWGIDEHTTALIDLQTKKLTALGKGKIIKL
jgi:peptidase E